MIGTTRHPALCSKTAPLGIFRQALKRQLGFLSRFQVQFSGFTAVLDRTGSAQFRMNDGRVQPAVFPRKIDLKSAPGA